MAKIKKTFIVDNHNFAHFEEEMLQWVGNLPDLGKVWELTVEVTYNPKRTASLESSLEMVKDEIDW